MDMTSYLMGKKAGGGGGPAPSGTLDITANGTYDVTQYAQALVDVSGDADPYPNDTMLAITLTDGRTSPRLGMAVNGTARIDWGDGSAPETVTGDSDSAVIYTPHTYAKGGDYKIYILVDSGKVTFLGSSSSSGKTYVLTSGASTYISGMYSNAIKAVRIGAKTALGTAAFHYCEGLSAADIRCGMDSAENAFEYCRCLQSVALKDAGLVANAAFQLCTGLVHLKVLPGTNSFALKALDALYSLGVIDLSEMTSVPSLIFAPSGWPEDVVILVPANMLDAFRSASNWSRYASNMQGV